VRSNGNIYIEEYSNTKVWDIMDRQLFVAYMDPQWPLYGSQSKHENNQSVDPVEQGPSASPE